MLLLGNTNDFGQNWLKPFKYLLLSTAFFYCLIISSTFTHIDFTFNPKIWVNPFKYILDANNLRVFPQLLNPTFSIFKIKQFELIDISFWAYLFDLLHKIILSFFIYQLITAFRKYGGKSE